MTGLLEVTCWGEFRKTPAFAVSRFCPHRLKFKDLLPLSQPQFKLSLITKEEF
jgi:hypothetical protein